MTEPSIQRIRNSFEMLALHLDAVVAGFYERLFADHPSLRQIFPKDMTRQRAHLAAALAVVSRNIDRLDMLEAPLMALGAQHVRYGTRPEHYPIVRDALLASLGAAAGDVWTEQLQADWTAVLNEIITLMLRGHARAVLEVAGSLAAPTRGG